MRKWMIPGIAFITLLLLSGFYTSASGKEKKKDKKEVAQASKYDKLFEGKVCTTVSGEFMTLHKVDGKLYFELPLRLLGREMLLSSTASRTSDNLAAVCGYGSQGAMHIRFVIQDDMVQVRSVASDMTADREDERMQQIIAQGYADPILYGYKILAYNRDSSAVVFDVTSLFTSDVKELTPLVPASGMYRIMGTMKPAYSLLGDVKVFEDNVTIRTSLSYSVNVYFFIFPVMKQEPVSVEATRTLVLLPEKKMRPRLSDSRIGVFLSEKEFIPSEGEEIKSYAFARRWRVEPRDAEAYRRGVLTEPVKPIVMYVDDHFPESWKEPIRKGILKWNRAFEKIGFKNVIQVRDFPTDDPAFDPDNLKYSCVRYVPFALDEAIGPFWFDPSTGEILNARIIIFNDVVRAINNGRFLQTAQVDPRVRTKKMPGEVIAESLEWIAAQEMGHCLGLMNNMGASSAFPVDSLRSAVFTRKYGIAPSIMDKIRYNYVAQPEDQDVQLTPVGLGVYDEYAINWLYTRQYDGVSVREEAKVLESWTDEKAGDPLYRYGKQQWVSQYDPSALDEDLGDDAIKAGDYGMRNLQYIVLHMNEWIDRDAAAEHRKLLYANLTKQYERYLLNTMCNVGGIYLSEVKDGTPGDRFRSVPKEIQRASARWVLRQIRESAWLDNRELVDRFGLGLPDSWRSRINMMSKLLSRVSYVALSSHVADEPYTMADFVKDVYDEVWDGALNNRRLTAIDRMMQFEWLDFSQLRVSKVSGNQFASVNMLASSGEVLAEMDALPDRETDVSGFTGFGQGYGWQKLIETQVLENQHVYYFNMVRECREMLKKKMLSAPAEDRAHYQAMLMMANKILKEKE